MNELNKTLDSATDRLKKIIGSNKETDLSLEKIIEIHTHNITDRAENKWNVIEVSDLQEINEAYASEILGQRDELLEALKHGVRLSEALHNSESIAVKSFVRSANKAINKTK